MKKFFKTIAAPAAVFCSVLALGLSTTRCTSVDDTLGQNFIPGHQNQKLQISTLNSVRTYLAKNDSIASNHTGSLFFGQMQDAVFGTTVGSAMTDFFPPSTSFNSGNFFGYKPVADSAFLLIYVTGVYGNPENTQTFNVYALRDSLQRSDTVYRFNTPLQDVVDMTRPLFSFTLGDIEANTIQDIKLEPTADGTAFLQKIVDTDSAIFKNPIPAFHERFYGLYIAPAPGSPTDAALYEVSVRTSGNFSSSMILHFHNINREKPTENLDTLGFYFPFSDTSYPNMNVNKVVHSYPPAIADNIIDPFDPATTLTAPLSTVYIQSLGGVATYLDFSKIADGLKTLKPEGKDIMINQALIYFPLDDPSTANLNVAPVRLGMYFTYGQQKRGVSSTYGPIPITDYNYEYEYTYSQLTPFDGHLYRSTGFYRMNITGYITRLINDPENTPMQVWLGNEVGNANKKIPNGRNAVYSQVALQGSEGAENPIKLVVTYTLIH